ncbi:hypothetical protein NOGI109294_21870 [Nocardiopsis gilva]|uniref:hypothetical protein n=1 Tax=Nocardiopsis gilva TaxID=280236 RepID=UPI000524CBF1|nr:hypothetical protein [Nocardiopsis gilva]
MTHGLLKTGAVAALGALALASLPSAEQAASAAGRVPLHGSDGKWIDEDLTAADRVGAALDGDRIRVERQGDQPLGASLRSQRPDRVSGGAADERPEPGAALEREIGAALATFPAHELDDPASAVDVAVDTTGDAEDFQVEVRGLRPDGIWTEWREAPGAEASSRRSREDPPKGHRVALSTPVEQVQVRVGITLDADEDTALRGVRVRPSGAKRGERHPPGEPFSARLFATRIGQVGGLTANGHRIRSNDQFAALPSRRGLATRGGSEYTVRVCTTDGTRRCVYMPVWDVGPWNTKDDHWNAEREKWRDLSRGTPQAQAAYSEGYNGGRDGFGRKVANPAGIDLADGAFREGLGLRSNAWVTVDYLWTAKYTHRAEVGTASQVDPVIIRPGPGASFPASGLAAHKATIDVLCQTSGDRATGPQGETDVWYRIGEENYVPAAFVKGGESAPPCPARDATADAGHQEEAEPGKSGKDDKEDKDGKDDRTG